MPRSRSRSVLSITRSATCWLARNAPLCRSSASTSVVLPWSTCAMIATLRRSGLAICRDFRCGDISQYTVAAHPTSVQSSAEAQPACQDSRLGHRDRSAISTIRSSRLIVRVALPTIDRALLRAGGLDGCTRCSSSMTITSLRHGRRIVGRIASAIASSEAPAREDALEQLERDPSRHRAVRRQHVRRATASGWRRGFASAIRRRPSSWPPAARRRNRRLQPSQRRRRLPAEAVRPRPARRSAVARARLAPRQRRPRGAAPRAAGSVCAPARRRRRGARRGADDAPRTPRRPDRRCCSSTSATAAGTPRRVARLTLALADELGVDEELILELEHGALLHDIGKLDMPASILRKPAPLDDDEWEVMRTHPQVGYDLLRKLPRFSRRGRDRPRAPRGVRRQRVSPRPEGRRDSDRRADPDDRRLVRLDDAPAHAAAADAAGDGDRGDRAVQRVAVRSGRRVALGDVLVHAGEERVA